MNKLILGAVALISSYSYCMDASRAIVDPEEKTIAAAEGLLALNKLVYEARYGSPVRNPYKIVLPDVKAQRKHAVRKIRYDKWTPEKIAAVRKCLFPAEIATEGKKKVIVID